MKIFPPANEANSLSLFRPPPAAIQARQRPAQFPTPGINDPPLGRPSNFPENSPLTEGRARNGHFFFFVGPSKKRLWKQVTEVLVTTAYKNAKCGRNVRSFKKKR